MSTALIADPKSPTALPKNALRRSSFITVTPMRAQRCDIERPPVIRQSLTSRPVASLRRKVLQRSAHGHGPDWRAPRATLDRHLLLVLPHRSRSGVYGLRGKTASMLRQPPLAPAQKNGHAYSVPTACDTLDDALPLPENHRVGEFAGHQTRGERQEIE